MATDVLGVAVIGCGFFGRQLARSVARQSGARLVVVADLDDRAASALAGELGCDGLADVGETVVRPDVDAVMVATPNHVHVEPVLAAAEAGKHVFVEKPMALAATDCRRMLLATETAGVRLVVGHIMRLFPGVDEARCLLAQGALGRIVTARALRTRWAGTGGRQLDWWKLDRSRSGGELLHEIHELDLLCWLLGEVTSVAARVANLAHPEVPGYDDVIHVSLEHASGALATVETGTAYQVPAWPVMVGGTEGGLVLDFRTSTLTRYAGGVQVGEHGLFDDERANETLRAGATTSRAAYNTAKSVPPYWMEHGADLEVSSVVAHFRDGTPTPLSEDREMAVGVAEAASRAAVLGRPVDPRQNLEA
jgi:predicted dehydrogenase